MKKLTSSPFWALAVVAALGMGLTACGSGSDSNGGPDTGMTDDTPDPAIAQRDAIKMAIAAASTAVGAVDDDSSDATVGAADTAIANARSAIAAAADVPMEEKDGHTGTVNALASDLGNRKTSRTAAMDSKSEQEQKTTIANAKALKNAIDTVDGFATKPAVTTASIPAFDPDGDGTITTNTVAITLKKVDAADMLNGWSGQDYMGENGTGDAKTTGMVRVYSNAEAPKSVSFTTESGETIHGLQRATGAPSGDYTLSTTEGDPATADPAASREIGGFPTTGTTSYEEDDTVTGTYMGAAGTYKCVSDVCTSIAAGANGIDLGTGWTFTPAGGAVLQQKDAQYLQFGWWVRKDKDGPTHAGVIYSPVGTGLTAVTTINSAALVGKATYMGKAAGKFAISDPLRPAYDNAGHFTADAELMADFKETESTLSGTIDAFRLNDGSADPGWSVALQKTLFDTDKFVTDDSATTADRTVWSIDGLKGPASGSWEAQLFNDKAKDDKSNVPDSVAGSFSSSISTTHSMVGAFGATKTKQ